MKVALLGAGGHAKVIVAALQAAGRSVDACYVAKADELAAMSTSTVLGVPVRFEGELPVDAELDVELVIATGNNALRQRLAEKFAKARFASVVHPRAWVHESVVVGAGAVVFAGAMVQPGTTLGAHAIVNTASSVDHDCVVGAFAHIAPGAHLAGDVKVGDGAFIGTGAAIIPGRSVGAWAVVGAGASVVHDVGDRVVVVGIPARPLHASPPDKPVEKT